ncbi:hypothetical protein DFP72DRAFT_901006 [Ephemerocybe angulata]|uniref:F-box domain-containing protein n=1 Tax=Ephemerocybe angulata TaxID=980116 RepID=A0A8H6M701_9AGAR|nr:hypothetical protein DFP72DRAFT_901006 [Tulosesus angulatus]
MNGNVVERRIESPPNVDIMAFTDVQGNVTKPHPLSIASERYQGRISRLKKEEIKIQEAVMHLLEKAAEVRADIVETEDRLALLQAPVRTLPQEVLEAIFLAKVKDEQAWPDAFAASSLALTQVCSLWRRIAVQLPSLWARFTYRIERPTISRETLLPPFSILAASIGVTDNKQQEQQERLGLWFERSKPYPVSLCIRASNYFEADYKAYEGVLRTIISTHHLRLEVLRIDAAHTNILSEIIPYSSLTTLKRLELNFESCHQTEADPIMAFRGLPSITSIIYNIKSSNPFLFPVKWSNLTNIDMGDSPTGISITRWKFIIRCCTNLERARFFVSTNWTGVEVPSDIARIVSITRPCVLPRLRTITLTFEEPTSLAILFDKLEFPALHTLELFLLAPPTEYTLMSWYQVFGTLTSLRALTISCTIIPSLEKLRQCFNELPELQCLKIKAQNDSALFDTLCVDKSACIDRPSESLQPSILPNLRRLSVWAWNFSEGDHCRFWDMVDTRTRYMHERALDASALELDAYESSREDARPFVVDVYIDKTKMYSDQIAEFWQKTTPSYVFRDDMKRFAGKLPQRLIPPYRVHIVSPYTPM